MRLWTKRPIISHNLPRVSAGLLLTNSDLSAFIHLFIIKKWRNLWENQEPLHNKLLLIKPTTVPWFSFFHSRRLEIILIGHTHLTHSHLVSHLFPHTCDNCGTENLLTVAHTSFHVHISQPCGILIMCLTITSRPSRTIPL